MAKDLTPEQIKQRFDSTVTIIFNQPNNRMMPGTCDYCGVDGPVWMRSTDGPKGCLRIEVACEKCCTWKQQAATA